MQISHLGVLAGGTYSHWKFPLICFFTAYGCYTILHAILEAQENVILSAVNTEIQGLQSNLLKAQMIWRHK